ncbi:hypothetical protein FRX31_016876 [Thalictrum thalictroides]|uniref:Pectinesterase inhibitor domain-containing protein n=1 Tax=Thalictrum thalictroides TaxID=46969 RepID=A0A7J6W810_THATH|nr:hypothetical protein FRX31_016876 [Thalictrum thalictroides]
MDDYMKSCYGYCSQKFSDTQHSLDEAVNKFNSNDYSGAASSLVNISSFPDDCETKFLDAALSAPLLMKLHLCRHN